MRRAYDACLSARPPSDEEIDGELATYPRYQWASDETCWAAAVSARRELLVRRYAEGHRGRLNRVHEHGLKRAYGECLSRQEAAQLAKRADDAGEVTAAVEALGRPEWAIEAECWPAVAEARGAFVRDYWRRGRELPSRYDIAWRASGEHEVYEECVNRVSAQRESSRERARLAEEARWTEQDARRAPGPAGEQARLFGNGAPVAVFVDRSDARKVRVQRDGKDVVIIDACSNLRDCPGNRVSLWFGVVNRGETDLLLVFRSVRRDMMGDGTIDATAFAAISDCKLEPIAHVEPGTDYIRVRRDLMSRIEGKSLPPRETGLVCHRPSIAAMGGDRQGEETAADAMVRAGLAREELRSRRDAVLRQCGGKILEQREFILGRNPHADKGRCIDVVARTIRMDSAREGLFDLGGGITAAVRFMRTFRGALVEGTVRVLDVKNVRTSKGIEQIVVLEMLDVRQAMTGR